MKRGDKFPVTIAGQNIAQAEVTEVADGTVTVVTPRTVTVFATRTEIAPEETNVVESDTQTIITGVDRQQTPEPSAPVVVDSPVITPPVVTDESTQAVTQTTEGNSATPEAVQEVTPEHTEVGNNLPEGNGNEQQSPTT